MEREPVYTEPTMYSITGKCGHTMMRITLRNMLELLAIRDRLEDDGWTVQGPVYIPDALPEGT